MQGLNNSIDTPPADPFGDLEMAKTQEVARPLSPHLQIYRFTITMAMSIIHRNTGGALYFGTLLLAWWLAAVAMGPDQYALFETVAGSWFGKLVLFGYTWALLHHLASGLRYLVWDNIRAFDLKSADLMSWGAAILGFAGAVAVWIIAFYLRGAL
jgi:succinate dehydrogenase / fumarate reductase cytochrome b subunit